MIKITNYDGYISWQFYRLIIFNYYYYIQPSFSSRMFVIVIGLLLSLISVAYYVLVKKPKMLREKYIRAFREKGYKVYALPQNYFGYPYLKMITADGQKGDALQTMKQIAFDHQIIIGNTFNTIQILVTSPELINQFAAHERNFYYQKRKVIVENLKRVVGNGIIFAEREAWKRKRKILSKIFTFQFANRKYQSISRLCLQALQNVQEKMKEQGKMKADGSYQYGILHFSGEVASKVVMECFLGGNSVNQTIEGISVSDFLIKLKSDLNKQSSTPLSYLLGSKFSGLGFRQQDRVLNNNISKFNQWGISYINKYLSITQQQFTKNPNLVPHTIIQALYLQSINKNQKQVQLSHDEMFQQFKNFHVGGTNSVSHLIQMAMIYLCQNPQTFKQLRAQVEKLDEKFDYSFQEIKKLEYLDAVVKQTNRMYGPTNFNMTRNVTQDHLFKGVPIYKGTTIKYNSTGIHYNTKYFQEPSKFMPERWLKNADPQRLISFGVGNRSCIGKFLGLFETKIAIVMLLKRYRTINLLTQTIKLKWRINYAPQKVEFEFIP